MIFGRALLHAWINLDFSFFFFNNSILLCLTLPFLLLLINVELWRKIYMNSVSISFVFYILINLNWGSSGYLFHFIKQILKKQLISHFLELSDQTHKKVSQIFQIIQQPTQLSVSLSLSAWINAKLTSTLPWISIPHANFIPDNFSTLSK